MSEHRSTVEQLRKLFGNYKAEWLRDAMFDLFCEPEYFPDLCDPRPCVLIGGRGTGKTTVLRCLSYEGRYALTTSQPVSQWPFYGFYYRVNTNRVTAFRGPELEEAQWVRLFAHFFNLELCDLVVQFLLWYSLTNPAASELDAEACSNVGISMHLPDCRNTQDLSRAIARSKLQFSAFINNVADDVPPRLSMQGAPIDALLGYVSKLPQFAGKHFYFLLDEYENFEDYQQQVVNTLLKHASDLYVFKIGVKELGWRRRATLNPNEQLISPADYVRINIGERLADRFGAFARAVCNERLRRVDMEWSLVPDVAELLPGISEEDEALRLGAQQWVEELLEEHRDSLTASGRAAVSELPALHVVFLDLRAQYKGIGFPTAVQQYLANQQKGDRRYDNYKHSILFILNRGKPGIRKYYTGWDVFTRISGNNIRYLLELVDTSISLHLHAEEGFGSIGPETQTQAAQMVGKKNLTELEGLSVQGAQLTKLLLGLGRIFGVMAARPVGHTPEVNQFSLRHSFSTAANETDDEDAISLLKAAVMHLALVRFPGTKLADEGDTREYDYSVHPIFAPYFVFSHRRKRKLALTSSELLGLVREPRQTIDRLLRDQNREIEPLPDQLVLFEGFYAGTK